MIKHVFVYQQVIKAYPSSPSAKLAEKISVTLMNNPEKYLLLSIAGIIV